MDAPLIITISLMVLIAAVAAGSWARRPGARPILGGIGLVLVPLGLYLFGLTDLAYNGVMSIISWAQSTPWSPMMTWGASLAGAGLLLFLVSRFVKPAGRKSSAGQGHGAVASQQPTKRPAVGGSTAGGSTPAAAGPPAAKPATGEDAEVEDILRKRGLL